MAVSQTVVVANWKMHPKTLADARKLFSAIKKIASSARGARVVMCPPVPYLASLREAYRGKSVVWGAQDVFWGTVGAHTGSVSAPMLKSAGASYVIVGHSERRALGETNEDVAKKAHAAMGEGMTAIVCVGERERDAQGGYLGFIQSQLGVVLRNFQKHQLKHLVVAYEPLWAIGKTHKDALDPHGVHEMSLYIRKLLVERYGQVLARRVPIIYGGSVEQENAQALLEEGNSNGFLVGHASLDPKAFSEILKHARKR